MIMVGRDYLSVSFVIHIKVRFDPLDLVLTKVVSIFFKVLWVFNL